MNFENIDAGLYLNITFFSVLGFATLFGLLKGFKKSLIGFLVNLAFYLVFFLTLDMVVGLLWSFEFAPLGGYIAQVLPGFPTTVSTVSGAVDAAVALFTPDSITVDLANPQLVALITGIGQFAIKLVYAVLYFTIGYVLFAIVGMIIKALFSSRGKYDKKYGSQNRGLGAVFGLLQGAVAVFVMMIMFGGLVSVSESLLALIPEDGFPEDVNYEFAREDIVSGETQRDSKRCGVADSRLGRFGCHGRISRGFSRRLP
ncbi:MAG: hypothetical protein MZU97_24975 [Bacillus subtilis]|nr:hypothetical protein [Bacillus subtilis]